MFDLSSMRRCLEAIDSQLQAYSTQFVCRLWARASLQRDLLHHATGISCTLDINGTRMTGRTGSTKRVNDRKHSFICLISCQSTLRLPATGGDPCTRALRSAQEHPRRISWHDSKRTLIISKQLFVCPSISVRHPKRRGYSKSLPSAGNKEFLDILVGSEA